MSINTKAKVQEVLKKIAEENRLPEAMEIGLDKETYAILLEPMITFLNMVEGVEIVKDANGHVSDFKCNNVHLTANGKQTYEIGKLMNIL